MDYGQSDFAELMQLVAGKPAFVKACLARTGSGWELCRADTVVGADLPPRLSAQWRYEKFMFIADTVPADTLSSWFQTTGPGSLTLGDQAATTPAVQQQVSYQRQPSLARMYDSAPLPWPTCDYDVHDASGGTPSVGDRGFLVGDDCPSFPSLQTAFRAFFTGTFSMMGTGSMPNGLVRIRVLQQDAWLEKITVAAAHLDVRLGGPAREGARVELNGSTVQTAKRVGKTGKVRMSLPSGLPDDAWLYLSRNRQWLDYRALGLAVARREDAAGAGVQVEVTDDPVTEIQALLSTGEGPRVEYKRQLPDTAVANKRKVLKTVAAFANEDGGHVLFGMDPDEVTLVGLGDADPREVRDRLGQLIRGNVVPADPDYVIRWTQIDGKLVVVLEVRPGSGRPYGLQFQDRPVEFYVRRGSSTYAATQAEVRALAQPVPSVVPGSQWFGG